MRYILLGFVHSLEESEINGCFCIEYSSAVAGQKVALFDFVELLNGQTLLPQHSQLIPGSLTKMTYLMMTKTMSSKLCVVNCCLALDCVNDEGENHTLVYILILVFIL